MQANELFFFVPPFPSITFVIVIRCDSSGCARISLSINGIIYLLNGVCGVILLKTFDQSFQLLLKFENDEKFFSSFDKNLSPFLPHLCDLYYSLQFGIRLPFGSVFLSSLFHSSQTQWRTSVHQHGTVSFIASSFLEFIVFLFYFCLMTNSPSEIFPKNCDYKRETRNKWFRSIIFDVFRKSFLPNVTYKWL